MLVMLAQFGQEGIVEWKNSQLANADIRVPEPIDPLTDQAVAQLDDLLDGGLFAVGHPLLVQLHNGELDKDDDHMPYVDGIWGCELLDAPDESGAPVLSEIVYIIDNTTKTRAIFEINKGIGKLDGIDVNSKIPRDICNLIIQNQHTQPESSWGYAW